MPTISKYSESINSFPVSNELSPAVVAELHILESSSQTSKKNPQVACRSFTTEKCKNDSSRTVSSIVPISVRVSGSPEPSNNSKHQSAASSSSLKVATERAKTTQISTVPSLQVSSTANKYYVCNIIRHQSTLWTSYRLYLDHVMDLNSAGELVLESVKYFNNSTSGNSASIHESNNTGEQEESNPNKPPEQDKPPSTSSSASSRGLFLLGAKKLTTVSMSSQWYIWDSRVSAAADSKFWKEKNATGRVSVVKSSVQSSTSMSPSRMSIPRIYTGTLLGMSLPAMMPLLLTQQPSQPPWNPNQNLDGPEAVESTGDGEEPFASAALNTASSVGSKQSRNSGGNVEAVAISVNSRGADKLIHLTIVAPRTAQQALDSPPEDQLKGSSLQEEASGKPESGALAELEAVLRTNNQALIDCNKYLLLKSKQPRKILTQSGKGVHAVEFGKFSRVKEASRFLFQQLSNNIQYIRLNRLYSQKEFGDRFCL